MPPSDDQRPDERPGGAVLSPPAQPGSPPESPTPAGQATDLRKGQRSRPALRTRPGQRAAPALQHRATAALFVALLSLFGLLAINNTLISVGRALYVVAFTLLAGVVGAWFAATAIGRARHQGTALPQGSIAALVIASIGIAVSGILVAGFALWGQQLATYTHCLNGANTVTAGNMCQSQFTRAVGHSLGVPSLRP
jgi:hypothetical protein